MRHTGLSWLTAPALSAVAIGVLALPAAAAAATTLSISHNSAPAGASVDMCVTLTGGERRIAGIQGNILLDARCANVIRGSGDSAECTVGPAAAQSGKQLTTVIGGPMCGNSPNCVRTLLLAFDNTDPIEDGTLFCCAFTIPTSAPEGDCVFQFSKVRGGTGAGQPIFDIDTRPGILSVSGGSRGSSRPGSAVDGGLTGAPPVAAGGAEPAPPGAPAAGQSAPAAPGSAPAAPVGQRAIPPTLAAPVPEHGDPGPTPAPVAPETGALPVGATPGAAPTLSGPAAPALPPRTAPAAGTETPAAAATAGTKPTAASTVAAAAVATPTKPAPTRTPTVSLPTTTPTTPGGWFSGCHVRR